MSVGTSCFLVGPSTEAFLRRAGSDISGLYQVTDVVKMSVSSLAGHGVTDWPAVGRASSCRPCDGVMAVDMCR